MSRLQEYSINGRISHFDMSCCCERDEHVSPIFFIQLNSFSFQPTLTFSCRFEWNMRNRSWLPRCSRETRCNLYSQRRTYNFFDVFSSMFSERTHRLSGTTTSGFFVCSKSSLQTPHKLIGKKQKLRGGEGEPAPSPLVLVRQGVGQLRGGLPSPDPTLEETCRRLGFVVCVCRCCH